MSRKNRKPRFTLSQDEAERLTAAIKNGEIVLESGGRRGDAMNRYAQALIGDDREGPLQDGASEAFTNCWVSVIPYSQLAKRAPQELAA